MEITRLHCPGCETGIDSHLAIPSFFRLPNELQLFVLVFLRCRGNIREVEKELGISYPTVCKRLDLVNEMLGTGAPVEESVAGAGEDEAPPPVPEVDAKAAAAPLRTAIAATGAAPAAASVATREEVLEQVERGEISAREAAQLLRQIKNKK